MALEQLFQRVGLGKRAGEAVEDEAPGMFGLELFLDQADDDLVCHQITTVHDLGHLAAHLGARCARLAQHVASGKLYHATLFHQPPRLGSLARARRP